MVRTNLALNPRAIGRPWSVAGGAGTQTDETTGGPLGFGYRKLVMTATTTTSPISIQSSGSGTSSSPVVAGTTYTISAYGRMVGGHPATNGGISVNWYDAAGVLLSADTTYQGLVVDGVWTRHVKILVAPAGAAFALAFERFSVGAGLVPVGSEYGVTGFMIEAAPDLREYLDGTLANDRDWMYAWTGTVNNSPSTATNTPGLYVERLPDAGAPQVGLTITGLNAGTPSIITVETSWDGGRTWTPIRSGKQVEAQGATFIRDFVPALNVEACYRVIVVSGPGFDVDLRTEDCITIIEPLIWLQDPLNPRDAVSVSAECTTDGSIFLAADSLTSSVLAQTFDIATAMDASLGVASIGRRALASRVPLNFAWRTAAEGGALRRLLMQAGQIVVRGLPNDVLQPVAHLVMGPAAESRTTRILHEVSVFEFVVNQVRPLSLKVVVPWWTYDQVAALWAATVNDTYAEVVASRPTSTYIDWQEAPEPT